MMSTKPRFTRLLGIEIEDPRLASDQRQANQRTRAPSRGHRRGRRNHRCEKVQGTSICEILSLRAFTHRVVISDRPESVYRLFIYSRFGPGPKPGQHQRRGGYDDTNHSVRDIMESSPRGAEDQEQTRTESAPFPSVGIVRRAQKRMTNATATCDDGMHPPWIAPWSMM